MNEFTPAPSAGWTHWTRLQPLDPLPDCSISYLVCSTPRSGSTFLCDRLSSTGLAGDPHEFFHRPRQESLMEDLGLTSFREYFSTVMWDATGPNGVCGAKVQWVQLHPLVRRLRDPFGLPFASIPEVLSAAFPNLHFIWLTRRDKLRQAISLWRAASTNIWHSWEGPQVVDPDSYNFRAIHAQVARLEVIDGRWQRFFADYGLSPYELAYEDFAEDPEAHTLEVLRWLGIPFEEPVQFEEPALVKLADATTEAWVRRYQTDLTRARSTNGANVAYEPPT